MSGVAVVGIAGGCGVTVLACAIALRLARSGTAPLLVDAGMHGGGPAALWGIAPARCIDDLLPLGDAISAGQVEHVVHRHPCGVDVIPGAVTPASALAWAPSAAETVAGHVAGRGEWVADAGRGDGPVALALMARASRVVAVVPATVHGLAGAGRVRAGDAAARVAVVASALPSGDALPTRAVRAALGGGPVVPLARDIRAAGDVAGARPPRGRHMARALDALLEAM